MVYIIRWRPMASWNASETPPLDVELRLLDICHCPGKDGPSVMQVVDKQLARVGLMRYDVNSMVGDGGVENEGMLKGMHTILETDVDGYVRRRCLGHLAWRVADAIIAEIADYHAVKGLCEYLHKGVTWSRLQVLAATPWSRTKFELELTIKSNMAATAQTHRIPQEFNRSKIETALDDREIQICLLESGFIGDAQLRQVEHLYKQRQLVKRCRGDP